VSRTTDSETSRSGTRTVIEEDRLSTGQVRERAVTGAAVDVLRGFGVRFAGLVGTLVLARLLTPHDFGIIAFGATFVMFGNFVADGGIAAALIRRVDPPTRADLSAFLALQLGFNTVLAGVVGIVLLPFGEFGQLTAIMMLALPLTALRVPGVILLERRLEYRPLALVEIFESICYYGWAIGTVSYGWGLWGLASASVVRALVGSTALLALVPAARLMPIPSWSRVRPLLGFGFKYQGVRVVNLFQEQGINAAVAAVAGVSALGIWSVAFRILQVPLLLFASLWRVSFPSMSRLVANNENVGPTIERTVASVAVMTGMILAPLVAASSPLVLTLLGEQWADTATVIPPASLNLMIAGPISVALVGYLWAVGDASAVLRATVVGLPVLAVVLLSLLPVIGVAAVGFGWIAIGTVESVIYIRAARKRVRIAIARPLAPPALSAAIAAFGGWIAASTVGVPLLATVIGGGTAILLYVAALSAWRGRQLLDTVHLVSRGMRGALSTSQ
jgi:O-antigen/teichoic acid export membrane protein